MHKMTSSSPSYIQDYMYLPPRLKPPPPKSTPFTGHTHTTYHPPAPSHIPGPSPTLARSGEPEHLVPTDRKEPVVPRTRPDQTNPDQSRLAPRSLSKKNKQCRACFAKLQVGGVLGGDEQPRFLYLMVGQWGVGR